MERWGKRKRCASAIRESSTAEKWKKRFDGGRKPSEF